MRCTHYYNVFLNWHWFKHLITMAKIIAKRESRTRFIGLSAASIVAQTSRVHKTWTRTMISFTGTLAGTRREVRVAAWRFTIRRTRMGKLSLSDGKIMRITAKGNAPRLERVEIKTQLKTRGKRKEASSRFRRRMTATIDDARESSAWNAYKIATKVDFSQEGFIVFPTTTSASVQL